MAYAREPMKEATVRPTLAGTAMLLSVAAVVLVADRLSKAWIVANVEIGEKIPVVGDFLQIWHTENHGAAFGLLQGGAILFVVVAIATFVGVAWVHLTGRVRGTAAVVLLGMVTGATLGSLIDRLGDGAATDFISVGIGDLRWPTFNVADASLVLGIGGLILLLSVLDRRPTTSQA